MRAEELAAFLLRHPERLVQVSTPDAVWLVNGAELDQFSDEEGPSVVLTVDAEEE